MQDTREKLEADAQRFIMQTVNEAYSNGERGESWNVTRESIGERVAELLDRQAEITTLEWLNGKTHIFGMTFDEVRGLQAKVAELTVERDTLNNALDMDSRIRESQDSAIEEIAWQRDQLSLDLDA